MFEVDVQSSILFQYRAFYKNADIDIPDIRLENLDKNVNK